MNEESAVVWVTQIPNKRDKDTGMLVPVVNVSPASEHGEVRVLMPPEVNFFATNDLVTQLRAGLRNYNYKRGDSVLVLGDPAIIAVVGAVLAERCKDFIILRWDRHIMRYVRVTIRL